MGKRRPLAESASGIVSGREALRLATRDEPTKEPREPAPRTNSPSQHVPILLRLRPDQREAIKRVAVARCADSSAMKTDISQVVREAIDLWIKHGGGQ